jgi:AraC family transcriptional regulator
VVPADARIDGDADVSVTTFPAMTVAEIQMTGDIALELRALDYLYKTWLPRSGYVPDHQPGFEVWRGLPFAHGFEHFEVDLHIPITKS